MSLPTRWFDFATQSDASASPVFLGVDMARPGSDVTVYHIPLDDGRLITTTVPNRLYGAEINHEGEAI
jgi:hypothetical protein